MKTDFLVIGSGIAGLRAAIELGKHGNVLIATKDRYFESSSSYAQGGIAVVVGEDDTITHHLEDTLQAGGGLCRKKAVSILVREGPSAVKELIRWGARFDKSDGEFLIGLEGAHSRRRILHFKDSTGEEIVRVLREKALENPKISKLPKHFVIDLLIREERCVGAVLLNEENGEVCPVIAKATVLATGGAGQIYRRTSNPSGATGDGIAAVYRSGGILTDMEFVQFHPTIFALPGAPSFLITEALRGEGAVLRNTRKRRFMTEYHPLGELAPRDEVSRAMVSEMKRSGGEYVLLDAKRIRPSILKERFPTAYNSCLRYGLDITKDMIPVSPGAHFMIGGVETDIGGRASIRGLFAAGEAASTGVHGANRLASNSLLEGLVFGTRAGISAAEFAGSRKIPAGVKLRGKDLQVRTQNNSGTPFKTITLNHARDAIKDTMWNCVGIIRSATSLEKAQTEIDLLAAAMNQYGQNNKLSRGELEIVNMLTTAQLIVLSALKRRESVGTHFREDFPLWSGKKRHIRMRL